MALLASGNPLDAESSLCFLSGVPVAAALSSNAALRQLGDIRRNPPRLVARQLKT